MGSRFPDPTEDDQRRMRRMARGIVRRLGQYCGDQNALTEDLEMDGWEAYYRYFGYQYVWLNVRAAMVNGWCQWRFGIRKRNHKEKVNRAVFVPVSLQAWDATTYTELQAIEAREIIDKLCQLIQDRPRYRGLGSALRGLALAEGKPLTPKERISCGISNPRVYSRRKEIIRRLTTELQQGAA